MLTRGKWLLGGTVAAGLLTLGGALGAPALAQGPGPGGGPPGPRGGPPGPGAGFQVVVESVTTLLGATPEELRAERQAGRSLADMASSRGVDQATLVQAIEAAMRAQLAAQVASGNVPADVAARWEARIDQGVNDLVSRSGPPGGPAAGTRRGPDGGRAMGPDGGPTAGSRGGPDGGPGPGWRGGPGRAFQPMRGVGRSVADLLGLTPGQLLDERLAGRSLADIAAARGIDQGVVVQTITTDLQARLADAVANGRLTQEQADARLQREQQFATRMVTQSGPPGAAGRQHQRDGGPRPGAPGRERGNRPGNPSGEAPTPQ